MLIMHKREKVKTAYQADHFKKGGLNMHADTIHAVLHEKLGIKKNIIALKLEKEGARRHREIR